MVEAHLSALVEHYEDPDDPESCMPAFVLKAFQSLLRCGDPKHGFIRLFCDRCQYEHPLPFSCKTRSICPSCGARRAEETVAHLMNDVLPDVPIRQYV